MTMPKSERLTTLNLRMLFVRGLLGFWVIVKIRLLCSQGGFETCPSPLQTNWVGTVPTQNIHHKSGCGVSVINPWEAASTQ